MLTTIEFDNQSLFKTNKINNVYPYGYLPFEFTPQPVCSEMVPKMPLSILLFFRKLRARCLSVDFSIPSPQPSPAKSIIILLKLLARERGQIEVHAQNKPNLCSKKLQGRCLISFQTVFLGQAIYKGILLNNHNKD